MRVYYLDTPLTPSEVRELEELLDWEIEQVRVPFLLPEGREYGKGQLAPVAPLKSAGTLKDYGGRCAFAAFTSERTYWTTQFVDAIRRLTGRWPFLIQTDQAMKAIGNTDTLRVLDLDGALRG
jgi:hypothetical protein